MTANWAGIFENSFLKKKKKVDSGNNKLINLILTHKIILKLLFRKHLEIKVKITNNPHSVKIRQDELISVFSLESTVRLEGQIQI